MSILGNYVRRKISNALKPLENESVYLLQRVSVLEHKDTILNEQNANLMQLIYTLEKQNTQQTQMISVLEKKSTSMRQTLNKLLSGDKDIDVYVVENYGKALFVCIGSNFRDEISQNIRNGILPLENINVFKSVGCFLDLGANIGIFSLAFGSLGWRGFAFEANKANSTVLSKSVLLNNFEIEVVQKLVHEETGELKFLPDGPAGHIATEVYADAKYETIPAICLDDWYKAQNIKSIDFIKIDIEGSEVAAFKGAQKMLAFYNFPTIFCEVNTFTLALQGETQLSLFNAIKDLGYKAYVLKGEIFKQFHPEEIPTVVVNDLWFIKNTDNLKYPIMETFRATDEEMIKQIKIQLQYHKSWKQRNYDFDNPERTSDFVCLALKDYPEYYGHPDIKALLDEIAAREDKYPLLEKMIGWYK